MPPIRKTNYSSTTNRHQLLIEQSLTPIVNDAPNVDALSSNSKLSYFTGDAGGQLGLVLGASFITLLEVIDLFVMVVVSWLKSKYGGKSTDV